MGDMRGQESPMDYTWENGHGPVDSTSPWQIKRNQSQQTPIKQKPPPVFSIPHSTFTTPSKQPVFSTPATSRPFSTPFTATPSRLRSQSPTKQYYREPSTPSDILDTDFEGPDTPDVDIPTPEPNLDHILHRTPRAVAHSLHQAPVRVTGRGEIRRGRDYDRIEKHRRRRSQRRIYITDSEDDDDESDYPPSHYKKRSRSRARSLARSRRNNLIDDDTGAGWDADKPMILGKYVNLILAVFTASVIISMVGFFMHSVWIDVMHKMEQHSASTLKEINHCQNEYIINRCAPDTRAPALENQCAEWELCMNQNPDKVGRATAFVRVLSDISNSFTDQLSWKGALFTAILFFGCLRFYNWGASPSKAPNYPHLYAAAAAAPPAIQGWPPHPQSSVQPNAPWMTPGYATPAVGFRSFEETPSQADPSRKRLEFN